MLNLIMMYCTDIPINFNKDANKTPDDADHHLLGINYVNHVQLCHKCV